MGACISDAQPDICHLGKGVDAPHQRELDLLFLAVFLVDAYSVNPNSELFFTRKVPNWEICV